jgi:hypothetical protein
MLIPLKPSAEALGYFQSSASRTKRYASNGKRDSLGNPSWAHAFSRILFPRERERLPIHETVTPTSANRKQSTANT